MQARPAYAAHAAAPPRTEPEYTSVAPSLYRAALGPVNVAHYLAAFERLDATGRVLPGWNTAAALCPLGWLAFRRLWRAALVYLAALAAAALLLFTAGHQWLALPPPMLAGLALAGLLVACGLPGLYGDALLHADVRRRIDRAVASAPTLREAMDLLDRHASSRRRLAWTAALGGALLLAAAVAWALFQGDAPRTDEAQAQAPAMPPPQPPARPAERMDALPMPSGTPVADAAAVPPPQAESGSGAAPEPAVPAAVVDAAPAPRCRRRSPHPWRSPRLRWLPPSALCRLPGRRRRRRSASSTSTWACSRTRPTPAVRMRGCARPGCHPPCSPWREPTASGCSACGWGRSPRRRRPTRRRRRCARWGWTRRRPWSDGPGALPIVTAAAHTPR